MAEILTNSEITARSFYELRDEVLTNFEIETPLPLVVFSRNSRYDISGEVKAMRPEWVRGRKLSVEERGRNQPFLSSYPTIQAGNIAANRVLVICGSQIVNGE